jgi:hypothetical protein
MGKNKKVKEIIKQWLEQNGYDGLYSDSLGCGCELSELCPCEGESIKDCGPGYKIDGCNCGQESLIRCDFHIVSSRRK